MSGGRTHRPEHNVQLCETCGGCTWKCPATIFPSLRTEKHSLRGALYQSRDYPGTASELPPCTMACPLGQDVPGYISAIAQNDFNRAANIICATNALPSVCGRVCVASCMRACTRDEIDEGVDIRGLKRAAVELADNIQINTPPRNGAMVAVVGAGPAGLAAAHRLTQLGVRAVVIDAERTPGGALISHIPSFVLPRKMVKSDIDRLISFGVEIRSGVKVGDDISWRSLERDFDAVLVATGAGRGVIFNLAGSDLDGVVSAASFTRAHAAGDSKINGAVIVEGGSMSALQSARLALRRGATNVTVVHPYPKAQWPADAHAQQVAVQEGVRLMDLHHTMRLEGASGRLFEVVIRPVKQTTQDDVNRPALSNHGKELRLTANVFVSTQERRPVDGAHPDFSDMTTSVTGSLAVDNNYRLGRARWYAAGEAATGAATVVDAMGTGRAAADAIAQDLKGGEAQ